MLESQGRYQPGNNDSGDVRHLTPGSISVIRRGVEPLDLRRRTNGGLVSRPPIRTSDADNGTTTRIGRTGSVRGRLDRRVGQRPDDGPSAPAFRPQRTGRFAASVAPTAARGTTLYVRAAGSGSASEECSVDQIIAVMVGSCWRCSSPPAGGVAVRVFAHPAPGQRRRYRHRRAGQSATGPAVGHRHRVRRSWRAAAGTRLRHLRPGRGRHVDR